MSTVTFFRRDDLRELLRQATEFRSFSATFKEHPVFSVASDVVTTVVKGLKRVVQRRLTVFPMRPWTAVSRRMTPESATRITRCREQITIGE